MVLLPELENGLGLNWWAVGVLVALAGVGELLELIAGAAKYGTSRRAILLSMFSAMVGSIVGALVRIPVLFVGPIIAALGDGALGAFGGAYLGETWEGRVNLENSRLVRPPLSDECLAHSANWWLEFPW